MPLQVLIVDDEPIARERLKRLLHKTGDTTIVAECNDGMSAVAAIQAREMDVVFLDVQMPKMTGFDVVRTVGVDQMPVVIFVTAFDQFALQAFEAQAIDYLLKPFGEVRLRQALARATAFLNGASKTARHQKLSRLLSTAAAPQPSCLLVRDRDRVVFVRPQDIDWVEADADYARLRVGSETHMIRSTLTQLEERLATEGFVRIHRSRLVNAHRIKELRRVSEGESVVILKSGERLRASQSCLRLLQERIGVMA